MQSLRLAALACLLTIAVTGAASAQLVVHYPDDNTGPNTANPGGWYPLFTNTTGVRYQIRIPASALANVPPGSTMVSLGFFVGTTNTGTNATYSILQYRLGPSSVPALTNTFDANLLPGTETLVYDAPNSSFPPNPAAGMWMDFAFTTPYAYLGTDLILDVRSQLAPGGGYFRQSVSSQVPRLTNTAYTGQATGTLGSSSGAKVRLTFLPSSGAEYQTNQPGAYFDVNGVQGTAVMPATPALGLGQAGLVTFSSVNIGQQWDLAVGFAPLRTPLSGALVLGDGQILNVDLTDPTLTLLFNAFQSPGFVNLALPFSSAGAPRGVGPDGGHRSECPKRRGIVAAGPLDGAVIASPSRGPGLIRAPSPPAILAEARMPRSRPAPA